MLSGILGFLFILSSTLCGFAAKQNVFLKHKNDSLKRTLADTMMLEANCSKIATHTFKTLGRVEYTVPTENEGEIIDTLESSKCAKCHLIRRFWVEGAAAASQSKAESPMDGYFRFSHRLEETEEGDIPCISESRVNTTNYSDY